MVTEAKLTMADLMVLKWVVTHTGEDVPVYVITEQAQQEPADQAEVSMERLESVQ